MVDIPGFPACGGGGGSIFFQILLVGDCAALGPRVHDIQLEIHHFGA